MKFFPIAFLQELIHITYLSLYSKEFYRNLYIKYKGYGLKYSFTLIVFTSILYSISIFYNLSIFKIYASSSTENVLDYIIKQLPELNYTDGSLISDIDNTTFIYNKQGKILFAIDLNNKLSPKQKTNTLFILNKYRIIFNLMQERHHLTMAYTTILGNENFNLNQSIKTIILKYLDSIGIISIVIFIAMFIIIRFIGYITGNLFSIILLYIILKWMNLKPQITSCSRIVLFSSAAPEILITLCIIFIPNQIFIAKILEYWTSMIAVYALSQIK